MWTTRPCSEGGNIIIARTPDYANYASSRPSSRSCSYVHAYTYMYIYIYIRRARGEVLHLDQQALREGRGGS